jgi:hypothetical protein
VVVVEIFRRNFLASMVPVIVNAILNEHQLVIDIVAFVIKGDFHRSRLGEKQRGKILAGWVTRKMRTIAQYSIRDPNGPENQMMISEEPMGRPSISMSIGTMGGMRTGASSIKGSLRAGSILGMTPQLNIQQANSMPAQEPQFAQPANYYPPNIPELGTNDVTPTEARHSFLPQDTRASMEYSPIDRAGPYAQRDTGPGDHNYQQQTYGNAQLPDVLRPGDNNTHTTSFYSDSQPYEQQEAQRWSFDSQERVDDGGGYGGGGGLRVANRDSSESESVSTSGQSWTRDVLAGMDFAGGNGGGKGGV